MTTNVAVACWALEQTGGATAIDDIPAMSRHIEFETIMAAAISQMPNHPVKLFIAPEYLFAERDLEDAQETKIVIPASRSQKHSIYSRLKLISARYPDIFIIAGTIAYEKRALGGLGSKQSLNVCPILRGGEIIKTIYKVQDDGFVQTDATFKAKGDHDEQNPTFSAGGITIGVDICADYLGPGFDGRLATYIREGNATRPDIHVQISGTNAAFPSRCQARQGGVYVHCDLGRGATAYSVGNNTGLNTATTPIGGTSIRQTTGSLVLFNLTL